jgi:hypothetical protein
VKTLLVFVLPPLAGALIGFVTNVIAIKMLFRPLREVRLFGIRLPFTPGILPRQRHKLADSIGAMVERELLTPDLLRQRLRRGDVREKAYEAVARFTAAILEKPLGDFIDPRAMSRSVFELLGLPDAEARVLAFVETELRGQAERLVKRAREEADSAYPALVAAFTGFLRGSGIHRELETHGWIFLNRAMQKLNVFQRFFISAAQYDRTLDERMPEIIDDLIDQAESLAADEAIRRRILDSSSAALGRLLAGTIPPRLVAELLAAGGKKPLGELLAGLGAADAPAGTLFAVSGERKKRLDEALCAYLLRIADEQIENVLASVNVRTMVSERIDSLAMIRVERIILDVMANQLKWINVFGAILGCMIGLVQVLCGWLLRAIALP